MAETFYNATEGSGKKFHAWDKVVGANTVLDEFTLPGEYPLPSYFVQASSISGAISADHLLQIMAGASLRVRVRRIYVEQSALITAASELSIDVLRLTTAGTGGTAITPAKFDTADAAAGCTAMTLPTAKGTEGTVLLRRRLMPTQTYATAGLERVPCFEWFQMPNTEPIVFGSGTANGIALKITTGRAGLTLDATVELVETAF